MRPHALIRLRSGELAYIARRIDLTKAWKIFSIEDFCQMDGRLTENTVWLCHPERLNRPSFISTPATGTSMCYLSGQ